MSQLQEILAFNEKFLEDKAYEPFKTDKFPNKKLVVLSCMDTRLTELLHKAMNLKNGDAKIIKNAGAMVTDPYESAMKSILVALYQLKAEEVIIVGHYGCGMTGLTGEKMLESMRARGISDENINEVKASGVDLNKWLSGFTSVEESVKASVKTVKNHPMLPKNTRVHGLVIDPETGKLDVVIEDHLES